MTGDDEGDDVRSSPCILLSYVPLRRVLGEPTALYESCTVPPGLPLPEEDKRKRESEGEWLRCASAGSHFAVWVSDPLACRERVVSIHSVLVVVSVAVFFLASLWKEAAGSGVKTQQSISRNALQFPNDEAQKQALAGRTTDARLHLDHEDPCR